MDPWICVGLGCAVAASLPGSLTSHRHRCGLNLDKDFYSSPCDHLTFTVSSRSGLRTVLVSRAEDGNNLARAKQSSFALALFALLLLMKSDGL